MAGLGNWGIVISIHAPREGCDLKSIKIDLTVQISIHAPREGCDCVIHPSLSYDLRFQSTHPVRGATAAGWEPAAMPSNFNPRTP